MSEDNEIIDLSSLDTIAASNKPYKLELIHPIKKNKLNIFIDILGIQSDTYRNIQDELSNERIREQLEANKTGKDLVRTIEETRLGNIKNIAACITGWENLKIDGTYPTFNLKNSIDLLTKYPWIRQQVEEAIVDLKNFMPG